jgi:hypothetical protein
MIYTQFGVPVVIEAKANDGRVFVQAQDSDWNAWRSPGDLRADGGSIEIQEASVSVPVRDVPPEPKWKGRLRKVLNER